MHMSGFRREIAIQPFFKTAIPPSFPNVRSKSIAGEVEPEARKIAEARHVRYLARDALPRPLEKQAEIHDGGL